MSSTQVQNTMEPLRILLPGRPHHNVIHVHSRRLADREDDRAADVFGFQDRAHAVHERAEALHLVAGGFLELGADDAGLDEGDADAVFGHLAPEGFGE